MNYKLINRIDNEIKRSFYLFLFLLIWLLVNLIQSAFTELIHDEAYYWMYSRNLAWGYFDHPPLIALLIKAGYSLFPSEFGVRLLPCLMGTITIFIIYCLIDVPKKSLLLYILIVCPIILVHSHVGGYLAIPDIPVLFFTALFFLVYKHYLEKDGYILAFILAIVAALMLYSKYHGILILLFTLAANIRITRRLSFWIIPIVTLVMLIPHLVWQIKNGFPTLEYHLFSRSSSYRIDYTINYLYSQFLVAGPLVACIILYHAFRYKSKSVYDRILKLNFIGVILFFFLTSFKGRVEAHWTAIAYIPMLVLVYKGSMRSPRTILWLKRLFLPSILLFFIIRVLLISTFFDSNISVLKEVHDWDKWARQIDSLSQGRKIIFVNSFQRPAKYSFYTNGKFAFTLNNIFYRKNQYDIWPFEDSLQHQPVLLLQSRQPTETFNSIIGEQYPYELIDDFVSYNNMVIKTSQAKFEVNAGDCMPIEVLVVNPRNEDIVFRKGDRIIITFFKKGKAIKIVKVLDLNSKKIPQNDSISFKLDIPMPSAKGKYDMYISIATANLFPALNCRPMKVIVE
jgi:hypothetical protein